MTTPKDFQFLISNAVVENKSLEEVSLILNDYKNEGGKQEDALKILDSMREDSTELYEDKILEVMDIASSFCQPQYKVWD